MKRIEIDITRQSLGLFNQAKRLKTYAISTAANGVGEKNGSECTPRGLHLIRAKIGEDAPENAVFIGRRWTKEIYASSLGRQCPNRDWILTRILWLSGKEPGKNRLGDVDTMRRYVYIHGTPDEIPLGKTGSRGCIRMRNADIIELFDLIKVGDEVNIVEAVA